MAPIKNILIGEYIVALGFSSWAALKSKQAPWPPTVIKTSMAFSILALVAMATPELAATLGGGFLMAQLIKVLSKQTPYTGGAPAELVRQGKRVYGIPPKPAEVTERVILSWKD
jgi:hypothetical protein